MKPVTVSIVKQALAPRPDDAHKGTMGTLLSICGCYGMAGACLLSSKAALRSGVGLLKCALPKSIYPIAAASIWSDRGGQHLGERLSSLGRNPGRQDRSRQPAVFARSVCRRRFDRLRHVCLQ